MNTYVKPFLSGSGEMRKYNKLKNSNHRNLSQEVQEHFEKNPVILSLTTSPIRLRKIGSTLSLVLNFPYIKEIHINLPKLYRNKEPYNEEDIKFIKDLDCKIKIFRVPKDIGPLTKILPTIERVKKMGNEAPLVISIDDDIGYKISLFYELLHYSYKYPNSVFSGSGFKVILEFEEKDVYWPIQDQKYPKISGCENVDVVEGYGTICYNVNLFDGSLVKKLNSLSLQCKLSDDLTISYAFAKNKVPRYEIGNSYFWRNDLVPWEYGTMADALHMGSQLGNEGEIIENANMVKYGQCMKQIHETAKYYS